MLKKSSLALIPLSLLFLTYLITAGDMNVMKEYPLSLVFLDMWNHLTQLNIEVSPGVIGNEGFLVNGKTIAYFLPFPALVRGLLSAFGAGHSAALSMLLSAAVYIVSALSIYCQLLDWVKISTPKIKKIAYVGAVILILSPPIMAMKITPIVFVEAVVWGASLFTAVVCLSLKVLLSKPRERPLFQYSVVSGLCLFTRPTYVLAVSVLFGVTIAYLITAKDEEGNKLFSKDIKKIIPYILIFSGFLMVLALLNYSRWGNPFEFYPLKYYLYQSVEQYQEYLRIGAFHFNRIPAALTYYFVPTSLNFLASQPFFITSPEVFLKDFGAPVNYREWALPIPIILPIYSIFYLLGMALLLYKLIMGNIDILISRVGSIAFCTFIPPLVILGIHANALRYICEFLPSLTLLSIFGWITCLKWADQKLLIRTKSLFFKFWLIFTSTFLIIVSIYCSVIAALNQDDFFNSYIASPVFTKKHQTIYFNNTDKTGSVSLLKSGWSVPEQNFCWSDGPSAMIRIPIPFKLKAYQLSIEIVPFINAAHPVQDVELWVDGVKLHDLSLSETRSYNLEIPVPGNLTSLNWLERVTSIPVNIRFMTVEFKFKNPTKPSSIGMGDDHRMIGLGLISMAFKN